MQEERQLALVANFSKYAMKKLFSLLGAIALLHSAQAIMPFDQEQNLDNAYLASFNQGDLAQSFKQASGVITGAGIKLYAQLGTIDSVIISLYDALPNAGGNLLASGSAVGVAGSWVDVFWSAVTVNPTDTYYLVFSGNNTLAVSGSTPQPYANGNAYANWGFEMQESFDYTFHTYTSEPVQTRSRNVPDSGSTLLLILGSISTLSFLAKRRK